MSTTLEISSEKLAYRPREAARVLSISERLLWGLTRDGAIPSVRVGSGKRKSVLYPKDVLQSWLAEQAAASRGCQQ
jgi:excisionase family DNA binding protein